MWKWRMGMARVLLLPRRALLSPRAKKAEEEEPLAEHQPPKAAQAKTPTQQQAFPRL